MAATQPSSNNHDKAYYIEYFQFSDKIDKLNILQTCCICHIICTILIYEYNEIKLSLQLHLPLELCEYILAISQLPSHK